MKRDFKFSFSWMSRSREFCVQQQCRRQTPRTVNKNEQVKMRNSSRDVGTSEKFNCKRNLLSAVLYTLRS